MPTFITTPYDDYYMSWTPGSTTEKQERAEQVVQAVSQQSPLEEIEARELSPFYFLD